MDRKKYRAIQAQVMKIEALVADSDLCGFLHAMGERHRGSLQHLLTIRYLVEALICFQTAVLRVRGRKH